MIPRFDFPTGGFMSGAAPGKRLAALTLGALGIVYGDIGTSPLYAMRECFAPAHGLSPTHDHVLGILSMILWSLILVVSIKYLALVLRADNHGEGGILALLALAQDTIAKRPRLAFAAAMVGLFGAALLYGDGVLTPAISVLSAVEGLEVAAPALHDVVLPVTVAILIALFLIQKRGTSGIGAFFGPITALWFIALGVLGIRGIVAEPAVFAAFDPRAAITFFFEAPERSFRVLGSVILAVTGAEALYADLGHFGRGPIRLAWFALVLPCLVLNYLGQGALMLGDSSAAENPFYLLAPASMQLGLTGLATCATVIASQAVISGAFSLTSQAIQLGFLPRMRVEHTSAQAIGQVYVPTVNALLLLGTLALVLMFKSSSALAAAYGIAVSATMVVTTMLLGLVAVHRWNWPVALAIPVIGAFLVIDVGFMAACALKFVEGGWLPVLLGIGMCVLMATWQRGRKVLDERIRERRLPLPIFLADVKNSSLPRRPGTGAFLSGNPDGVPVFMLHHLLHNGVLHERVLLISFRSEAVPRVAADERVVLEDLGGGFWRVIARVGFFERPSLPEVFAELRRQQLDVDVMTSSFYLGRESLVRGANTKLWRWQFNVFDFLSRNALRASIYFDIPENRVIEIGVQIKL